MSAPAPTLAELIDDYMAQYAGRDTARVYRLATWREKLGDHPVDTLTDDQVFPVLEQIAAEPARIAAGRDADGKRVHRAKGKRSGATVNRYHAALAAVFTWAIKKRRVPKGFENPCHRVEKCPESAGVVRFLSEAERVRLLEACRASSWPRLYVIVLMAITTGARRGELEGLHWRDVDFEQAVAHVNRSKNGESKTLVLLPAVLAELARFRKLDLAKFKFGQPGLLIFHSTRRPDVARNFEPAWTAARRAAKLKAFRFHDLRHTCASYLAQEGASLLEIADVMGHRQLAMVKRYAHLTTKTKAKLVGRVLGGIA